MSASTNEYDGDPTGGDTTGGPSSPDAGQDASRGEGNWGGGVADDVPPGGSGVGAPNDADRAGVTQDEPRQDTHETTDEDRLQGIVAQTSADLGDDASKERIADVLRQRIEQVGLDVGEDRLLALAAEIAQR